MKRPKRRPKWEAAEEEEIRSAAEAEELSGRMECPIAGCHRQIAVIGHCAGGGVAVDRVTGGCEHLRSEGVLFAAAALLGTILADLGRS